VNHTGFAAAIVMAGAWAFWPLRIEALELEPPPELATAEQRYRAEGPETTLPEFERLLAVYRDQGNDAAVAMTETLIGDCQWRLGQPDTARRNLDAALALSRELGFRRQEGKVLNLLGLLDWDLGAYGAAERYFKDASAIAQAVGDRRLEGSALNNLSLVYDELGQYGTSLAQYEQVLAIYTSADFARGEGDTLGNIGGVHLLLGHYSKAVDYYQSALRISEELGSLPAQSQDHGNLGYAYTGLGALDKAMSHFGVALDLAERSGMVLERGYWLRGLANAEIRSGRPDLGLANHRAALDIYRSAEADGLLLEGLHDMGQLMLELGDPVSAEQYFQQAMDLARSLDHARGITQNLVALGDLQFRHRRLDEAEAFYRQALLRAEASGEQDLQITGLLRLAALAMEREQYEEARVVALQAEDIAQAIRSLPGQAEAGLVLAGEHLGRAEYAAALSSYSQLGEMLAELGDPDLAWQRDYGRGLALIGLGRRAEAVVALQAAVERIEGVRARLQEKRFRTGYLQDKHQVYIELVRQQLDLGRNEDALTTAERLRTLSFNEQRDGPSGSDATTITQPVEFELRERIRQLQRVLGAERAQPEPQRRQPAIDHFSRELLIAEQQYQAWLDDAARMPSSPAAVPAAEWVGRLHERLAPSEALVEYVVAEKAVMIFLLRSDGLFVLSEPATQRDLRSSIGLLRDLIAQRDDRRWAKPAASLSATLVEPLIQAGWLAGVERLYLVPHGVLNYLPFAVLPLDGETASNALIDRYTLAYLPTALALRGDAGESATANWSLLGVAPASSRLRYAPAEASSIAELFEPRSRILDGTAATESLFRSIAPDYQVIHLATHGYFNKFNPLLSGLEMEADEASDGRLEVHEILGLQLNSDLVTLSACETGLGSGYFTEIPAGDDFVGMTRAFLQAGSASVLASLWEVDDRSTVDLMTTFYGELKHDPAHDDKAGALAAAQRSIKAQPDYRHPYYWAPFILVGAAGESGAARG